MVEALLTVDRTKRPSAEQGLQHPWFATKKDVLTKLYDKMLRKSGWHASNGETAAPKTAMAAPETPVKKTVVAQLTPKTKHDRNAEKTTTVDETELHTPCPPAKRPRELEFRGAGTLK